LALPLTYVFIGIVERKLYTLLHGIFMHLLGSENRCGKFAKLHVMAEGNNRDHAERSLFVLASYHVQPFTC